MDMIVWLDAQEECNIDLGCCSYAKELLTEPFGDDFFDCDDQSEKEGCF